MLHFRIRQAEAPVPSLGACQECCLYGTSLQMGGNGENGEQTLPLAESKFRMILRRPLWD